MRNGSHQWRRAPALCAVLMALVCVAPVRAHEIGTTRVSVNFAADGTYDIEIATDASALVEKLAAAAGSRSPADGPGNFQSLLTQFDQKFRERVKIAFDGFNVRPAITYAVAPAAAGASAAMATIRLRGEIPAGARQFTWTYSWTFASYALTVRSGRDENPATAWLEGGQTSAPFVVMQASPRVERLVTAWRY